MSDKPATPGVYTEEMSAFPNSVVGVPTNVAAFIGYTERAESAGKSRTGQPTQITSLYEYTQYFGGPPTPAFTLTATPNGFDITRVSGKAGGNFNLYGAMVQFFANGGGTCIIVSVGGYDADIAADALIGVLDAMDSESAILVIPDAVLLDETECTRVQQAMLRCCGTTQSRFAILDLHGGDRPRTDPAGDCIESFRLQIGGEFLQFGAAYYPRLNTTAFEMTTSLQAQLDASAKNAGLPATRLPDLHAAALRILNVLPPSGAMAGVYALIDNTRGVWTAPANVSLAAVVSPSVRITADEQTDLNTPMDGKAVNAIRSFPGQGVLVWGARTLDGNSQDWRYIHVRRTLIYLEQSIQYALNVFVFAPNDSNTWINVNALISNFLTSLWQQGGLVGASAADAFSVRVGLGETMTPNDILDGYLRVAVQVALVHPAEFIVLTFQQQMQAS